MKSKISMITLGVIDVKRSSAFYQALGFSIEAGDGDDYVMFGMEGTRLSLFPKEKLASDAQVANNGTGFSGFALAHNVASKELVNTVISEARAAGAIITKEPADTFWGGYSGYFQDPDGYLWEIAWNPFTDLT